MPIRTTDEVIRFEREEENARLFSALGGIDVSCPQVDHFSDQISRTPEYTTQHSSLPHTLFSN